MLNKRCTDAVSAYQAFINTPLSRLLENHTTGDPMPHLLELFRTMAAETPAYRAFLHDHNVDPRAVQSDDDFRQLPLLNKDNYIRRYPLHELCREGDLSLCDMIAVSSGSTGEPTFWPRFVSDEYSVARRFEQIFYDGFEADLRRTLAVVCFPLGTWVGGMFTASCCRHLAAKGYPITVVTPGNQKAEIFRVVRSLAPMFEQTVLLGYPPFLKDVVDSGVAEGIRWKEHAIKIVLAGEVFSEEWRDLMAERAGIKRKFHDFASLYGTADAGVLANETPLSVCIRRFLSERTDAARCLFGEGRLPTLVQYDPWVRYFEEQERTLVFSGDNGIPLIRYHISDAGGVIPYKIMLERLGDFGFDAETQTRREGERGIRPLPFVYVFGRSQFAVSYYGANIFPETVSIALEQSETQEWVTGKFVLEVREDSNRDRQLFIAVELAPQAEPNEQRSATISDAVLTALMRLNSEFAHYVPAEKRRPKITLWPTAHPEYFPVGVKHRYSRNPST